MDLANAIGLIQKTAVTASRDQVITPGPEPDHVYYMLNKDGEYEIQEAVAEPRCHQFDKLDSLVAFCQNMKESGGASPSVWCSVMAVVFVPDDLSRRDRAFLPLEWADLAAAVVRDQPTISTQRDPKQFVRMLRVALAGALPADSTLIQILRDTKWQSGRSAAVNTQHGKESMGREVEAEVMAGSGAIPEVVKLSFPLFKGLTHRVDINCALEIDPHNETLCLTPFPDACDNEADRVVREIAAEIDSQVGCPVYLGAPTPH